MFIALPPPASAPALQRPPLSFEGFRAGMPVAEAAQRIKASGGTLRCKATLDWRMRDCTGSLRLAELPPFEVLVSSVHDSAAVIVLSLRAAAEPASRWIPAFTETFGTPNLQGSAGKPRSWQWIRSGTMLRVVERKAAGGWEASITLTHGPLLDGLGPTQRKPPG